MSKTNTLRRRNFIQGMGVAAGALAFPSLGAIGANDKIRVGIIGTGSRGLHLPKWGRLKENNAEIVAISDVDTDHMDHYVKKYGKVDTYQDYRKLLERDDIDAVYIATPNHWHTLQAIHAMQAGKDVFLEKPITFNLAEGAALIAARDKYKRIVQPGTQNRSDTGLIAAFEYIHSGAIGKITKVKGLCYKNRKSIGKLDKPLQIPDSVDYNLWLGGSQDLPIMRPQLHYDWHWDFNTGNGDIGNQGPHEFDLMCWALGDKSTNTPVRSFGNRFGWNDAGNTPNLQTAWWEIDGIPCTFEVNNMWITPERNASPAFKGNRIGVVVTCEGGEFNGGRGGGFVVGEDGKTKIEKFPGEGGGTHFENFLQVMRSRKSEDLRAQLENVVYSTSLPHMANISHRAGAEVSLDDLKAELKSQELLEALERYESQLASWDIDLNKNRFVLGPEVNADFEGNITVGNAEVKEAAKPVYREGFEVTRNM